MQSRSFCIHGHFYQPPREDPDSGVIPKEVGAAPYSNWNERIHAECYRPNAGLRNFEKISFNVGPTLYRWMASFDPETGQKIAEQDRVNVEKYGVGNAIAQAYNHTILPLASYRDKVTQVRWGIADFEFRFGRRPQGIWLPETAVDTETLEVLADHGIEFTILAPWQAQDPDIDPTEPYLVPLSNSRQITVFFYQRELSGRISFDPSATINADHFAQYILPRYYNREKERKGEPQLILVASDGELYGHHQSLRDHFLAHLVNGASSQAGIQPTFPALWLKDHPPKKQIRIREQTSWSCHHGVVRWMGDCPCTYGDGTWKAQLRYALERTASELDKVYLDVVKPYLREPWELRHRYIDVMLGKMTGEELLSSLSERSLTSEEIRQALLLLEAQWERQRMFTSCGWFFEDFDRIEPRNNVAYAAQAVRLTRLATGIDLAGAVKADLKRVKSERTKITADQVFERHLAGMAYRDAQSEPDTPSTRP